MSENKINAKQSSDLQDIQIARLAFIGASISTLGDGISAVAAGLALEALEKPNNQGSQNSDEQSKHAVNLQNQIDYIVNELKQMKRMMN
ncbi:translation initiation factor 2 [Viridibacillus arvi]|uniref:translation initiation factor 2 n=1 Tax=Viridibacillus arvi TaxID=263475 RepID=UPI00381630E6